MLMLLFILALFSYYGMMDKDVNKSSFFHTFCSLVGMIASIAFIIKIIMLII